jgi:predicted transcriptional regulator
MPATKPTAKQEVERVLAKLPDDASLEDVQYHLYVLQHIERGRRDIEEGRVLSAKEVERRMARWLDR